MPIIQSKTPYVIGHRKMMNSPTTSGTPVVQDRATDDTNDVMLDRTMPNFRLQDPGSPGYYSATIPATQLDDPEVQSEIIRSVIQTRLNKIQTIAYL